MEIILPMEPWLPVYLNFFALFLFSMVLLFAAGRFILYLLSPLFKVGGFYQKIFFSLALGIFSTVLFFSVFITHFITISTGFLLIIVFLLYELYRIKSFEKEIFSIKSMEIEPALKKKFLNVMVLFLLSLFFFSWQAATILKRGNFPFVVQERDFIFYADLSEMIWKTGQENTYLTGNLISRVFFGITPYHYFELWLAAFFSWIFQIENLPALQLLIFPIFFLMMTLGIYSVAETFSILTLKKTISIFPLLFIGGIPFIIDHSSDYFQWVTDIESPLFSEKTAHYYWIAMIGFLFILNGSFTGGFNVFLSLLFVSGTTLPGIAGGSIAFLTLSAVFKLQEKDDFLRQSFFFLCCLLFFGLIYFFFGNQNFNFQFNYPLLYYTDLSSMLHKGFNFFTLKVFFIELAVRIYRIPFEKIIVLLPFIFVIIFLKKEKYKSLNSFKLPFIFIFSVFISSVICYGIFYKMFDSIQFIENIYFFILSFFAVLILVLWKEPITNNLRIFLSIMFFLVFLFKISIYLYNKNILREIQKSIYSDAYLLEISKTGKGNNLPGVFFRSPPGKERETGRNQRIGLRMGGYTNFFPQYSQTVDMGLIEMTNWDIGRWGEMEKSIVKTSVFYQYVEDQKKKDNFKSIAQSQVDFIDEFNIGFAIADKNVQINPLFAGRVKKVITDPGSGERFMLLK